ncbi:hypothetical protein BT69DRAFT_501669 [Atractiella rhizophila]|nr:hypothetical protein BT69DRAFT_501669 [Atractiella rhizophila]
MSKEILPFFYDKRESAVVPRATLHGSSTMFCPWTSRTFSPTTLPRPLLLDLSLPNQKLDKRRQTSRAFVIPTKRSINMVSKRPVRQVKIIDMVKQNNEEGTHQQGQSIRRREAYFYGL